MNQAEARAYLASRPVETAQLDADIRSVMQPTSDRKAQGADLYYGACLVRRDLTRAAPYAVIHGKETTYFTTEAQLLAFILQRWW